VAADLVEELLAVEELEVIGHLLLESFLVEAQLRRQRY
jgi:hypothetical protein